MTTHYGGKHKCYTNIYEYLLARPWKLLMQCGDGGHLPAFSLSPSFTIWLLKYDRTEMLASQDSPYHLYPLNIYTTRFATKILTIQCINNLSLFNVWSADGALILPKGSYCLLYWKVSDVFTVSLSPGPLLWLPLWWCWGVPLPSLPKWVQERPLPFGHSQRPILLLRQSWFHWE